MSGDIDKILSELSKMQIPQFFGAIAKNIFVESVTTSDSVKYTIGNPPLFSQFSDGPVITSEKMLLRPRYVDQAISSESMKSRSGNTETVLLTDLLKEKEKLPESGAGTSELIRYKLSSTESSISSDILKFIKLILTDSVTVTDRLKGLNNYPENATTSEQVAFRLKVPESVVTSDLAKSGTSFKQTYPESATITDLFAKITEKLPDSATTSDQERHKWKFADSATASEVLKALLKSPDSSTLTDAFNKITAKNAENSTTSDLVKLPLKNPDSSSSSDLMAFSMNLGTGASAELETTTDVQSSMLLTDSITDGTFESGGTGWSLLGLTAAVISTAQAKYGTHSLYCNGGTTIATTSYATFTFGTAISSGIMALDAWVYIVTYGVTGSAGGQLFETQNSAANSAQFAVQWASDGVYYNDFTGPAITKISSTVLPLNKWNHVSVRYDITNKTVAVYANGLKIFSNPALASTTDCKKVFVGDVSAGLYSGQFYWDQISCGTIATQGSSLVSNATPLANLLPFTFDNLTGNDSSGTQGSTGSTSGGGSVMAGTLITMWDGSEVLVERLEKGMLLRSHDPSSQQFFAAKLTELRKVTVDNKYTFSFKNTPDIEVDYYERFWAQTKEGIGWKLAGHLKAGDSIYRPLLRIWVRIASIQVQHGLFIVYDPIVNPSLQPEGGMSVIANGYLDYKVP